MTQAKEFIFEDAAREKLRAGIDTLFQVSSVTLGPKGRNVGLDSSWGTPTITSDGHSIVKELKLKDQYVNMGVEMGKDLASKMKEACGDGTTTAIVLLNALTQGGCKLVASGASPILIKRGMEKALAAVTEKLDHMSTTIKDNHDIYKIAEAASSGSLDIASMLANAFKHVGHNGAITIEDGKTACDDLEIVEGMQIDRGYLSPHFCTNRDKMTAELTRPKVLITDKKIHSIHEILPILQQVAASGSSLLIIADDIEADALATLVVNTLRGILKVAAIKAPGFGEHKKALLEDLAILTGATVLTEEAGLHLKEATIEHLGRLEKAIISKDKSLFTQDDSTKTELAKRIKQLDVQISTTSSSYDKDKLIERKSKLSGGVAVIHVGAPSEPEMKKKKQLFLDALSSTKAALEHGIVIGAGMSLVRASCHLKDILESDEKLGFDLVVKACVAPALQIMKNAGFDPQTTLADLLHKPDSHGLNVVNEEIENLSESGIFDATKVVKTALSLAVSTAGIVLLSEALIGNAPQDEL